MLGATAFESAIAPSGVSAANANLRPSGSVQSAVALPLESTSMVPLWIGLPVPVMVAVPLQLSPLAMRFPLALTE